MDLEIPKEIHIHMHNSIHIHAYIHTYIQDSNIEKGMQMFHRLITMQDLKIYAKAFASILIYTYIHAYRQTHKGLLAARD